MAIERKTLLPAYSYKTKIVKFKYYLSCLLWSKTVSNITDATEPNIV